MMAKRSFSKNIRRKYYKEKKNYKVSNERVNIPDGKAIARIVEKVYFMVTAV
jgi:hypothetical protein